MISLPKLPHGIEFEAEGNYIELNDTNIFPFYHLIQEIYILKKKKNSLQKCELIM